MQHIQSDYVTAPNITTVTNGALGVAGCGLELSDGGRLQDLQDGYQPAWQGAGWAERVQALWLCDGGVGSSGKSGG
jgi:hypothetical protein